MTIWLYCLFGKESLIMPFFLRHYAPQVDKLIMLDGDSDPKTKEMILRVPHAVIRDTPFRDSRYDDVEFVRYAEKLYREARGRADWVLLVDMDEFIWFDGAPIRRKLENMRALGIRAVQFEGWQMIKEDGFPEDNGRPLTEIVTEGFRDHIYDKMLAFDPMLDIRWSVGRHSCAISDGQQPYKFGKLLHYRWFGEQYHIQRNARNHARKSQADLDANRGYHTRPDYNEGRYSAKWFKSMIPQAENVTMEVAHG